MVLAIEKCCNRDKIWVVPTAEKLRLSDSRRLVYLHTLTSSNDHVSRQIILTGSA
jgi:hypothetical protein